MTILLSTYSALEPKNLAVVGGSVAFLYTKAKERVPVDQAPSHLP